MGQYSPEQTLAFLIAVVAAIAFAAIVIRRLTPAKQPTAAAPHQPAFTAQTQPSAPKPAAPAPSSAPAPVAAPAPQSVQPPRTQPAPAPAVSSQAASQPSYTLIAAVEAAKAGPRPAPPATAEQQRIDYSSEATSVSPGASYAAIAVATAARAAQGLAGEPFTPCAAGSVNERKPEAATSYAAIAAASARAPQPQSGAPQQRIRIDYSDMPADLPPNASYTAIAVAAARAS